MQLSTCFQFSHEPSSTIACCHCQRCQMYRHSNDEFNAGYLSFSKVPMLLLLLHIIVNIIVVGCVGCCRSFWFCNSQITINVTYAACMQGNISHLRELHAATQTKWTREVYSYLNATNRQFKLLMIVYWWLKCIENKFKLSLSFAIRWIEMWNGGIWHKINGILKIQNAVSNNIQCAHLHMNVHRKCMDVKSSFITHHPSPS